jgi:hypothetical protein
MLARAAEPFAELAQTIHETVRNSPVIASDETSARVKGKTHWQWTFVAATAVAHLIAPTRGKIVPTAFLDGARPKVWLSDRLLAQSNHAEAHQFCLAHLIRDAQYAIDAGDTVFAPQFKAFLQRACDIGRRRPDLADATIKAYARTLARELDRLLKLKPTNPEGRHLRDAIIVDASDKLLVFLTRRDAEPTNNVSERTLRPSVTFQQGAGRPDHHCLPWLSKLAKWIQRVIRSQYLRSRRGPPLLTGPVRLRETKCRTGTDDLASRCRWARCRPKPGKHRAEKASAVPSRRTSRASTAWA